MRLRRLPALGIVALVIAALVTGGLAVRARRPGEATPSPAVAQTSPAATATALPSRAIPAGRFVVAEYHGSETLLLSASAATPADRRPLARIDHAPNWAPRTAIAPGGDLVAYTVLPAGARSPDTEGTLWVVGLSAREPRRVAARVDVRVTPVWAPDGTRVVYQRALPSVSGGLMTALEEVDVRDGKGQELAQAPASRLFPAGYAPDAARFYYVRFEREGTFLHEIDTRSRAVRQVARLGDGAARDFELAPDGSALLYLAVTGTPPHYEARVADLRTGATRMVLPGVSRAEDVGVAWRPGAQPAPVVGMVLAGGPATGRLVAEPDGALVAESAQGFDVPVAWSADGRLLLVRSFSGRSADEPGREQPALIDGEGVRRLLTGEGPLEIVGWVADAP
jgi:dipeptidyl aminopeptidase/acylaminoacyl peptidase